MAEVKADVTRVALQLFAERSARAPGRAVEQVAIQCFRDAEAFAKVQADYAANGLGADPAESPLADCFAPNLKRTHPHNLVSREWGDLNRVRQIGKLLTEKPNLETYEELDWDVPTTRLARTIFPHYALS